MNQSLGEKQKGYVLVTSLLLLVVMASLGVSMYGNVGLQEKMSSNLRVKNSSLLVADSALQNNFTYSALNASIGTEKVVTELSTAYDSTNGNITMTGEVSVCYLGYVPATGNSINSGIGSAGGLVGGNVNHVFVAAAYAQEAKTKSITTVEQGGYIEGPAPTQAFTACDAVAAGFKLPTGFQGNIKTN